MAMLRALICLGMALTVQGFFVTLDSGMRKICFVLVNEDEAQTKEEVNLVAVSEFHDNDLKVKFENIESSASLPLTPTKVSHVTWRYEIHTQMYPRVKMCLSNKTKTSAPIKLKVVFAGNAQYTNKNDLLRSQKMMEVLARENQKFSDRIQEEDLRLQSQIASLGKSSWYLYIAIAAKIYVFFVLAVFQGGLFVRHIAESNKNDLV